MKLHFEKMFLEYKGVRTVQYKYTQATTIMKTTYNTLLFPFIYVSFLIYRHISMTSFVPLLCVWIVSIPALIEGINDAIKKKEKWKLFISDVVFMSAVLLITYTSYEKIQKSNYGMVWFFYYLAPYAIFLDILILYSWHRKNLINGLKILNALIFVSMIGGLIEHVVYKYVYGQTMWRIVSVYINTFMLSTVALFALFLPDFTKNKAMKCITKVLYLLCILFSYSRNIWVAATVILIIHFINAYQKFRRNNVMLDFKTKRILLVSIVGGIVLLLCILVFTGTLSTIIERLHVDKNGTSYQVRIGYLKYALASWFPNFSKRDLFVGRGYRSSRVAIAPSNIVIGNYEAFDNMYVTLLYEYGLCGVIALCITLYRVFAVLRENWNKKDLDNESNVPYCAAMLCVAALIPSGFYEIVDWHSVYFLLLAAIGIVFVEYHRIKEAFCNE